MQYIGESKRRIRERFLDLKGYVLQRKLDQATGFHFNQPGHTIANMTISVLERVKYNDTFYRREREKYLINKFQTNIKGLNKK